MGSFFKFVAFVLILSFLLTTVDQVTRSPASGFFEEWIESLLLVGVVTFFIMAFVLSVGGVTREFSHEAKQAVSAPSHSPWPKSLPPVTRSSNQAFTGFHGQAEAVRTVVTTITAARQGLLTHPDGPLASFFFLGPTGVGKTELAHRIAAFLGQPLAQFNMGEFVDRHSAYRFTGAPPGYIGSDQPGQLAHAVSQYGPSLVLLFDEITLAHPTIWDTLMGLLDKGTFQDGSTGAWYQLQHRAVIIMTSNALEDRAEDLCRLSEREIRDLLSSETGWRGVVGQDFPFRKAFVGRMGRIVPFRPLSPEAIQAIVKDRLDVALASVRQKSGLVLTYGDDVLAALTATLRDAKYGVREIDSLLYEKLSPALATVSPANGRQEKRGRLIVQNETLIVHA